MMRSLDTLSSSVSNSASSSSPLARLRRKLSPRRSNDINGNPPLPPPATPVIDNSSPTSTTIGANQLQKVFDYFDEDGDGKISPAELHRCITTVGGQLTIEEAEAAVRSSDVDGDGLLGFQDFQSLMAGSASEEEKMEELRQAFGMYETEPGSDCITPTSLKRMLSRLGDSRSVKDCKAMIRTFDLNGDGVLSFHEFAVMMR